MINFSMKALSNLEVPNDDSAEQPEVKRTGLLSRNVKPKSNENILDLEPRERIGRYVADIRKARRGLKNV